MNMKSLSSKNIKDNINFRKIAKQAKSNYKDLKGPIIVIIKNSNNYDNNYLNFIYNLYTFKYQNGNFAWKYITETERIYYSPEKRYNNMEQLSKYLQTNFKYNYGNFILRYVNETRIVRSSSGKIKKNIKDIIIKKIYKNNLKDFS